jgi:hypothetical protein
MNKGELLSVYYDYIYSDTIEIGLEHNSSKLRVSINPNLNSLYFELSDLQIAEYNLLIERVIEYSKQKTEQMILELFESYDNVKDEKVFNDMSDID